MKTTLLLLFLSFGAFSQVFRLDSTFTFETVKKQYNVISPVVNPLQDTLLNIVYDGNIYADKAVSSGNLLVNKQGKLIRTLPNIDPAFNYRSLGSLITSEGKIIITKFLYPNFTLQRINQDGTVDSTFMFPHYKDNIIQLFQLHNGNILVWFTNPMLSTSSYSIFDTNGRFVKTFQLSDYGFSPKAWLKNIVFNQSGEQYLYVVQNNRGTIVKLNQNLVRAESFPKINVDSNTYEAPKSKISIHKDALYLYNANFDVSKNSLVKYDKNGNKIWQTDFGKVSNSYSETPTFYHQTDESIDLIFADNKHIKIKADGSIDAIFYQNKTQEGTAFLHAFTDGTYWVMRNMSGLIEKMYADGSVDTNFKISTRFEKTLTPYNIEKQTNNYLVELIDLPPSANYPYSLRFPANATCIRIYNHQHKLLYDFFDSKTIWKTYKTENALIVRGNGKFYTIDSKSAMSVSTDTLQANDVIDWENKFVYRLLSDNLIARYKMGGGRDNSFRIDLYNGSRIYNFQLLNNQQIAVQSTDNSNYSFHIYNNSGVQDRPPHTLSYSVSTSQGNFNIHLIKDGYLIHRWYYTGTGNINQSFVKFKNDYTLDTTYQETTLNGGQFVRVKDDGTIFTNTTGVTSPKTAGYNFLKLLPTGKTDYNFALSGLYYTYGFEFFDDNTLYIIGDKGLFRFIRSAEIRYFTYNPLPNKVTIHSKPVKLNFITNIPTIKIEVAGNAILQKDSSIVFLPKAGTVSIIIKDENGKILAQQQIALIKVVPYFTYTHPTIFDSSLPYEFKAKSSSGLPVTISANGKEFIGTMPIDLSMGPYIKVNLKSEGNDQYETIQETLYFVIQSPLSAESSFTENNLLYYPNPARDELYIQANTYPIESFRLIGIKGNEIPIKAENLGGKYRVSLHNVPQGIYILSTTSGKKQFTHKIVIE